MMWCRVQQDGQNGCPAMPQGGWRPERTVREDDNRPRTPLAGFMNILLAMKRCVRVPV